MTVTVSPPPVAAGTAAERRRNRRLAAVWGLALLNVLTYTDLPMVVPLPPRVGQMITQGSLAAAFLLVLTINRRCLVRASLFLGLYSALAALGLMASVRLNLGSEIRAGRYLLFIALLWLLTPFWGRPELTIPRLHQRFLTAILVLVGIGLLLAPGKAFAFEGRLSGTIWPMPPTQVAHYAATLIGLTAIMWLCRMVSGRATLLTTGPSAVALLLTHTRTALLAMLVGLVLAILSLFITQRRARRVFSLAVVVLGTAAVTLPPVVVSWLTRGQESAEIAQLTGRTRVWEDLLATPRPSTERIIGSGLSNGSFHGLAIDNGWLATYRDQGLLGAAILAAALLTLVVLVAIRPSSPSRAMALFLLAYCLIASFTETGIGGATTYLLDLTVAASLLAPPLPGYAAARVSRQTGLSIANR